MHKKKLKGLKIDAVSESRKRALTTSNSNLAIANYTLDAVEANFTVAKNLKNKGKLE